MLLLGFIFKFLKKSLNRFCHVSPVPLVLFVPFVPPVPLVPPVSPVPPVPLVSPVPLVPPVPPVPPVPALPILSAFSILSILSPVSLVPQFKIPFALFRAHYRLKKRLSLWYIKENSRVVLLYCVDF